jgi:hypothetical protein
MKVGTLVKYIIPPQNKKIVGVVTKLRGKKWVEVQWSDMIIYYEHVGDLKTIS